MAEAKKRLLTYAGLKALEDELENLKVVKRKEVSRCGIGILVVIFTPTASLYSTRWKISSTGFLRGTAKTVFVHWQPPSLVRIRIGWICSTVGSSIWFLIGKEAIKSMQTVFRPYLSDRKGHVNLPFAGA